MGVGDDKGTLNTPGGSPSPGARFGSRKSPVIVPRSVWQLSGISWREPGGYHRVGSVSANISFSVSPLPSRPSPSPHPHLYV